MLENINYALFALLNATPASPQWAIEMAIFIAKDLIPDRTSAGGDIVAVGACPAADGV